MKIKLNLNKGFSVVSILITGFKQNFESIGFLESSLANLRCKSDESDQIKLKFDIESVKNFSKTHFICLQKSDNKFREKIKICEIKLWSGIFTVLKTFNVERKSKNWLPDRTVLNRFGLKRHLYTQVST